MSHSRFENLFKTQVASRDKFLSRLFGIFSEEIVRIWSDTNSPASHYKNSGRPTIVESTSEKGYTLDFTFERDGRNYICEMKCELEYNKYAYLTLNNLAQLDHHKRDKRAFELFLDAAASPTKYIIRQKGKVIPVHGAILIWGSVDESKIEAIKQHYSLHDILSVEKMIDELIAQNNQEYQLLLNTRWMWCQEFFEKFGLKM
jgi:hypothetical protein